MQVILTDLGKEALVTALNSGTPASIGSFKIGSDFNFVPTSNTTDVATLVYTGNTSLISHQKISEDEIRILIELPESVGDFAIGNIMIFLDDDTPLLYGVLPIQVDKVANDLPTTVGNRLIFNMTLAYSNINDALDITILNSNIASLPTVPTEDELPPIVGAPYEVYHVHNHTLSSTPILAIRRQVDSKWYGVSLLKDVTDDKFFWIYGGESGDNYAGSQKIVVRTGSEIGAGETLEVGEFIWDSDEKRLGVGVGNGSTILWFPKVNETGDIILEGLHNSGRIVLRGTYIWVDANDLIRFKNSAPANDTDGTAIATVSLGTGRLQFADANGALDSDAGLTYDKDNNELSVPGLTINQDLSLKGIISPTEIAADQNNYSPTGMATASVVYLTSDAARSITGLATGGQGRTIFLHNSNAANSITLANESASSTDANRFSIPGGVDYELKAKHSVILTYNIATNRWVVLASGVNPNNLLSETLSFGKRELPINATYLTPTITNGCGLVESEETQSGRPDIIYRAFSDSVVQNGQLWLPMPKSWDGGTLEFQFIWSHPDTTTNFGVAWDVRGVAISNDETADVVFGTSVSVIDTGGTTNDIYISEWSSAVTIAGTPAAGDSICLQIRRDINNVGDNMAVEARLIGIRMRYSIDKANDA